MSAAGDRAADRGDAPGASSMWKRAFELLPDGDPDGSALAAAAAEGAVPRAHAVALLADALDRARRAGAAAPAAGIAAIAASFRMQLDPSAVPVPAIVEFADAAEPMLAADPRYRRLLGWVRLWNGIAHHWLGQMSEASSLCARAAADGDAAGDRYLSRVAATRAYLADVLGSTPVDRLLEPLEPGSEHLLAQKAFAFGLAGRVDDARALATRAVARADELGLIGAVERVLAGWAEILAERPDLAEPLLQEGYDRASRGFQTSISGSLARVLHDLGRDAEALAVLAEPAGMPADDYEAVALHRSAHAEILVAQGELKEAERLAREGTAALDPTGDLVRRGETHLSLAIVLRAAGREDEAVTEARIALELFERKGDVPDARRARSFLGESG